MTEEQRRLCRDLVVTPPRGVSRISKEEFLRRFPAAVEHGKLALAILADACKENDAEDLQCALIIGFAFGFATEHKNILCQLVETDWHHSHEDVVVALKTWVSPDTVEALFRATQWIPKYLEYDDTRALAVKATWAIGNIPGIEASTKLEILACSENVILKKLATVQLERRNKTG